MGFNANCYVKPSRAMEYSERLARNRRRQYLMLREAPPAPRLSTGGEWMTTSQNRRTMTPSNARSQLDLPADDHVGGSPLQLRARQRRVAALGTKAVGMHGPPHVGIDDRHVRVGADPQTCPCRAPARGPD